MRGSLGGSGRREVLLGLGLLGLGWCFLGLSSVSILLSLLSISQDTRLDFLLGFRRLVCRRVRLRVACL